MSVTATPLRRLVGYALLLICIGVSGCTSITSSGKAETSADPSSSSTGTVAPEEPVAVIGDRSITRSELMNRLIGTYGADTLREILLGEAVTLETQQLGIGVTDEELDRELRSMSEGYESETAFYSAMEQQLGMDRGAVREDSKHRLLLEKLATRKVKISETDIRRYYEEHNQDYAQRKQFQLAWILAGSKDEADRVLGRLENGEDFAALAGEFSNDEATADAGGDLGWVDDNDSFVDEQLITAASQLRTGEAAGPLKTEQGYAVLQLKGEKTTKRKDLSEVRDEIRRLLAMEQAMPIHDLEQSLLSKYHAKVLDPRLSGAVPR